MRRGKNCRSNLVPFTSEWQAGRIGLFELLEWWAYEAALAGITDHFWFFLVSNHKRNCWRIKLMVFFCSAWYPSKSLSVLMTMTFPCWWLVNIALQPWSFPTLYFYLLYISTWKLHLLFKLCIQNWPHLALTRTCQKPILAMVSLFSYTPGFATLESSFTPFSECYCTQKSVPHS